MKSDLISSIFSWQRTVIRRFGLAASACALVLCTAFASMPARARGDLPIAPAAPVQDRPGSVTHGHVFLVGPGVPVDVTSQIVTEGAQTYYVDQSGSWPIYIDYAGGAVFNSASYMIGYVDLS